MKCVLFDGLNKKTVGSITALLKPYEKIECGKELYKTGFIGLLSKGKATVMRKADIGQITTVRNLYEGEIFGAASVFGKWKEGMSSIVSQSECEVYYISENEFTQMLLKFPDFSVNYIKYLTDRIRFLNRRIDSFTAGTTEQRLYEFLLSCADINGNVKLNFGMSELARRLHVGRTSLYRDIETLKAKNLIIRDENSFKIFIR